MSSNKVAGMSNAAEPLGTGKQALSRDSSRVSPSFSDQMLERRPINLGVLPVPRLEWSNLGNPGGSWPFCPAWEFTRSGRLPNRR